MANFNRRICSTGTIFWRLTVLSVATPDAYGRTRYMVQCSCGIEKTVKASPLHGGRIKSCGCLKNELAKARTIARNTTHGDSKRGSKTSLYETWEGIKRRCYSPTRRDYSYYGGRGITMYPRWVGDFAAFRDWILANLGPRPKGMSIDRIDNDGNYEPGNVRWATQSQQIKNRRFLGWRRRRHDNAA